MMSGARSGHTGWLGMVQEHSAPILGELVAVCKEHRRTCRKCGDPVELPKREPASVPAKIREAA